MVGEIYGTGSDILEWIGSIDKQTLFRREQLRQALCLMGEDSADHFLSSIRSILFSDNIRFHLKHLCLEVLGQLDKPSDARVSFLLELANDPKWKEHVFGAVFFGHRQYVDHLVESGTIADWLEDDTLRDHALWLLRGVAEAMPEQVAALLSPDCGRTDEWNLRILGTIPWHAEGDSGELFRLRMDLARNGVCRDFMDWGKLQVHRRLTLLASVLSSWRPADLVNEYGRGSSRRSRLESWTKEDVVALRAAVSATPLNAWALLTPELCRLAPTTDEPYGALRLWIEGEREEFRHGMERVPHSLVGLIVECGKQLAAQDSQQFWEMTSTLRGHLSPVVQYVLVESYSAVDAAHADLVIDWLLADLQRLCIGTGENEPEWAPAARLIANGSQNCSEATFKRLECDLIHYHSPNELRNAQFWLGEAKNGYFGDYWGRAQHFLLPALPEGRRSAECSSLIGVLQRKYEFYSDERFLRGSRIRGGFVGSTLNPSLERISDDAWLRIVSNKELPNDSGRFRHWHDGHVAESSTQQFSQDFARVAKRFPERFGNLALRFPADAASDFRAAILDALSSVNADGVPENEKATWEPASPNLIEKVLSTFRFESGREYAIRFCWLIYNRAAEQWSAGSLDQLADYACNHSDPELNRLVIGNKDGGFDASSAAVANLEQNALNSVRAVAGLAIGELLRNHPALAGNFRHVVQQLCRDPHPAVRIAGIRACLSLLDSERDFAIQCFCDAAAGELRVAASHWAVYFFNVAFESHYEQLAPVVLNMVESGLSDVAQQGAAEVAARWIFHGYFDREIESILTGSVPIRIGIAHVVAQLAKMPEYFSKSACVVRRLQNDEDSEVRAALRSLVRTDDALGFPGGGELVADFTKSQAFLDDPTDLVFMLREYRGDVFPFADIVVAICEQFIGPLADASRDRSYSATHDFSEVLPMLIRVFEAATEVNNATVINKCLDLFDLMFERRLLTTSDFVEVLG